MKWAQNIRIDKYCFANARRGSGKVLVITTGPAVRVSTTCFCNCAEVHILCSFSPGTPVFLLHLKMGFLNKSVSGNIVWSHSASADWHCMALRLDTLTFLGWYVARYKNRNLFIYLIYLVQALVANIDVADTVSNHVRILSIGKWHLPPSLRTTCLLDHYTDFLPKVMKVPENCAPRLTSVLVQ